MKKLAYVLVLVVGLPVSGAHAQSDTTKEPKQKKVITLQIEGMTCELCAQSLRNSLEKLEGISIYEIDPEKGFARLSFKPDNVPSDEILKEKVENAGFKLTKIQRNEKNKSDGKSNQ